MADPSLLEQPVMIQLEQQNHQLAQESQLLMLPPNAHGCQASSSTRMQKAMPDTDKENQDNQDSEQEVSASMPCLPSLLVGVNDESAPETQTWRQILTSMNHEDLVNFALTYKEAVECKIIGRKSDEGSLPNNPVLRANLLAKMSVADYMPSSTNTDKFQVKVIGEGSGHYAGYNLISGVNEIGQSLGDHFWVTSGSLEKGSTESASKEQKLEKRMEKVECEMLEMKSCIHSLSSLTDGTATTNTKEAGGSTIKQPSVVKPKRKSGRPSKSDPLPKEHLCNICGKNFGSQGSLRVHNFHYHGPKGKIKACQKCGKEMVSININRHEKRCKKHSLF